MKSYVTSYNGLFARRSREAPVMDRIEIPIIQRDYAQGRDSDAVARIRANFLDVLHDAVTTGAPISLDFVYGDVISGTLRPLDGQQRLTTLFLLHWYLAWRADRLAQKVDGAWADLLDFEEATVTCPAGQKQLLVLGQVTRFEPQTCDACTLKSRCTTSDRGRSLRIAEDEPLQAKLRARMATPEGRAQLRQRVSIEHTLAHVSQQQGNRARYMGKRKNEYDLHRTAVVVNLQTVRRELERQILANAA